MAKRPSGFRIDDPAWALVQALISYWGVTDAAGGAGGADLQCADLANQPEFDGNQVVVISGPYGGQARDINGTTLVGTVTPASNFGGVITANTIFAILPIRTVPAEVAALVALVNAIEAKLDGASGLAAIIAALVALDGVVDTHDFDIKALLTIIDNEIAAVEGKLDRTLFSMDFWSAGLEEVQLGAGQATIDLPDIVVEDLPDGATVVRAIVMFKFRMIENEYAGVNKLQDATVPGTSQVIHIRSAVPLAYVDAINFVDDFFTLAEGAREGGDVIVGTIDVSGAACVDENDTYELQWLLSRADADFLNFNDVQVGLRIWYSV